MMRRIDRHEMTRVSKLVIIACPSCHILSYYSQIHRPRPTSKQAAIYTLSSANAVSTQCRPSFYTQSARTFTVFTAKTFIRLR